MNARIIFPALALLFCATWVSAQTRKLKHRSHSGVSATFVLLLEEDHLGFPVHPLPVSTLPIVPWVDKITPTFPPKSDAPSPLVVPATPPAEPLPPNPPLIAEPATSSQPAPAPAANSVKQPTPKPQLATPSKAQIPTPAAEPQSSESIDNQQVEIKNNSPFVQLTDSPPATNGNGVLLAILLSAIAPAAFLVAALRGKRGEMA